MSRTALAVVCSLALPAAAQPGLEPLPAPPLSTRPRCDEHTFYLEPSLLLADDGDSTTVFHRIAGGARFHNCDPDGAGRLEGRLAATVYASGIHRAEAGLGFETELDFAPARGEDRIGLRLGYESANNGGRLYTVGVRYRPGVAALSLDAFAVRNSFDTVTGVMVGVGVEGRPGRYIVLIEGIATAFLFAVALAAFTGNEST